jgi:hypothetical protein
MQIDADTMHQVASPNQLTESQILDIENAATDETRVRRLLRGIP